MYFKKIYLLVILFFFIVVGCGTKELNSNNLKSIHTPPSGKIQVSISNQRQQRNMCKIYENKNGLYQISYNPYERSFTLSNIVDKTKKEGFKTEKEILNRYNLKKVNMIKEKKECKGFSPLTDYKIKVSRGKTNFYYTIEYLKKNQTIIAKKNAIPIKKNITKATQTLPKETLTSEEKSKIHNYIKNKLPSEQLNGAKLVVGKIWQDQPINIRQKIMNYKDATQYCQELTLLNNNHWRLPTLQEYQKLGTRATQFNYISSSVNKGWSSGYFTKTTGCEYHSYIEGHIFGEGCVYTIEINSNHGHEGVVKDKESVESKYSVRCVLEPFDYAKQKLTNKTKLTKRKEQFYPIDYIDLLKFIEGNTLILKSKHMCQERKDKECVVMSLLKKDKESLTIYPESKKIIKDKWGVYPMDAFTYGLHMGIITIPVDSNKYPFKSLVKANESGTIIKFKHPIDNYTLTIYVRKGIDYSLLESIKSKNYKKIDETGRLTIGQLLMKKAISKVGKALSTPTNSSDMQKSCLAQTKEGSSYCYGIKDKDMQNSCLAQTKYGYTYCYGIKDKDMQNSCLAQTKEGSSYCYGIKDKDMQNSCLAQTKEGSSYCYGIKDKDMQNSCLAQTKNDNTYCYGIK